MKESYKQCEFAISLSNAPQIQTLIHQDQLRLFRSSIICQLLLPSFSDSELLPEALQDKTSFLPSNDMQLTYLKDVGCFGSKSQQCPHPNSIFKVSKRQEYHQLRLKTFPKNK